MLVMSTDGKFIDTFIILKCGRCMCIYKPFSGYCGISGGSSLVDVVAFLENTHE